MGWMRGCVVAGTVALAVVGFAAPLGAADEPADQPAGVVVIDEGDEAQPDAVVVLDDETSETVRRIRRDLVTVGVVVAVALAIYVWHTSPRRRLRVAARHLDAAAAAEPDPATVAAVSGSPTAGGSADEPPGRD